jgi:hypothetical protein
LQTLAFGTGPFIVSFQKGGNNKHFETPQQSPRRHFFCLPLKIRVISVIPQARSHEAYLQFVMEQLKSEYSSSMHHLQDFFTDLLD